MSRVDELAHEIAYETARSDIECHGIDLGNGWRDVGLVPHDPDDLVRKSMRYLDARGLLVRDFKTGFVRVLDAPASTALRETA